MSETEVQARKVRKRISWREEQTMIRGMPRTQRLIVATKFVGVVLFAIGLEGVIQQNWLLAVAGIGTGIATLFAPIKVRVNACLACQSLLEKGQAICPKCGAPQM